LNKKRKVLFITKYFYPHIGGVEKHVFEISKELIKKGIEVTIITEKFDLHLDNFTIKDNIRIIRISYPKIKMSVIFIIWLKIFSLFREFINVNVVHIHDVFVWFIPLKIFFPKKPVYITFHGYEDYPITIKYRLIRLLSEKLCDGNICIGRFIKKWYGIKPNIIRYGAVDIKKYENNKRMSNYKYDSIFVGRLDVHTGINFYIKTYEVLNKTDFFSLLVVGKNSNCIKQYKNIKFVGEKNNVEKYFQESRIAFVSRYLSIFEAFASKKLVFAVYDNPVKEDYLKMTPFSKLMIICNSPAELIYKINYYKNNQQEATEIVNNAYFWVKNKSWEKLSKDYLYLWGFIK
jgi:glycosyltransferase involved in cell wall biosynthesis